MPRRLIPADALERTPVGRSPGQAADLAFNPFTETPVEGVHYGYGSDSGQPIGPFDYQAPREFSIALGLRY
jgi:hypothetical protein